MKGSVGLLLLLALCVLAVPPAPAEADDDHHDRDRHHDHDHDHQRNSNETAFVGQIISIRTDRWIPPPGALPNPPNTSRVVFVAGGLRVLVAAGSSVTNPSKLVIGATVSGTGTQRSDGSIVAVQVTYTAAGTPGHFESQISKIDMAGAPIPFGALPNPRGTSRILTLANGERVIIITDIPVKNLSQMVVGATVSGEGTPRSDGSIVAIRIRFD